MRSAWPNKRPKSYDRSNRDFYLFTDTLRWKSSRQPSNFKINEFSIFNRTRCASSTFRANFSELAYTRLVEYCERCNNSLQRIASTLNIAALHFVTKLNRFCNILWPIVPIVTKVFWQWVITTMVHLNTLKRFYTYSYYSCELSYRW